MKNLLIYISPTKDFTHKNWENENEILVKLQIDNSLDLGWRREDILLVTNFPYQYNGVNAWVIGDENYCDFCPPASKINAIISLFKMGLIGDDLYWFHDFDAFQQESIVEKELNLEVADMGLTPYGNISRWSTGIIFFKKESMDIFNWIREIVYKYETDEERAAWALTGHDVKRSPNSHDIIKGYSSKDIPGIENINKRVKKMNLTYNFSIRNRSVRMCYGLSGKPLKIIHFHPFDKRLGDLGKTPLEVCMYGQNKMDKVLMSEGLIKIFKKYGIK